MSIKQLSVFVENEQGKLAEIVSMVSGADINIRAMSIADTKDFGILRMITSDSQKTIELLQENTVVTTTDVLAVKMEDRSGALCDILCVLDSAGINVEYMYAFTASVSGAAYVVFRVFDVETAEKVLADKGFDTINDADIAAL